MECLLMARIRSVKPEICTHEVYALLSDAAERTLVRLWTHADDEGRGIDNVKLIKAAIYPLNDEKTEAVIDAVLDELHDAGRLWRYPVAGKRYFVILNFPEHQNPRHPIKSKYPPPPDGFDPNAPHDHVPPQSYGEPPQSDHLCTAGGEGLGVGVGDGGGRSAALLVHDLLAPNSEPPLLEEVEQVLAEFTDRYPIDDVSAAVQRLVDDRRRFVFPSKVRTALAALLGPPPAQAQAHALDDAQKAQMQTAERGLDLVREALNDPGIEQDPEKRKAQIEANRAARKSA